MTWQEEEEEEKDMKKDGGKYHFEKSAIRNESHSNDNYSKLQQATSTSNSSKSNNKSYISSNSVNRSLITSCWLWQIELNYNYDVTRRGRRGRRRNRLKKDCGKYHFEKSAIRNESHSNDYDDKLQQQQATTKATLVATQST